MAWLEGKVRFFEETSAPTANDDQNNGYRESDIWLDLSADIAYRCVDATAGTAVWNKNIFFPVGASDVELKELATSTYDDLQDWLNLTQSAGLLTGGEITDGGSGTVDVVAGTGFIKTTDSSIGETLFFDWEASAGLVLTDLETNTVYINYNIATKAITVVTTTTPSTINHTTQIAIGTVYRCGTDVHILVGGNRYYNISRRVHERLRAVDGIIRASGLVVSEIGTRNISMTEGVLYAGVNKAVLSAIDTSVSDVFTSWYYDGDLGTPAWVSVADQTQIDNLQYNAVATGLANLGVAKYGVHWVYVDNDGHVHTVYGQGNYNLSQTQQVSPPSSLPCIVADFSTIIAKIIIGQNSATFTEISYPFTTQFSTSLAAIHNELSGVQGGTADEYYHLTAAEYAALGSGGIAFQTAAILGTL